MSQLNISRRKALKMALFGPGCVGLQSLATGIPISALLNGIPINAHAQNAGTPQNLILISRSAGDPFNANAPGSYVDGVVNNPDPSMAPTNFYLGSQETTAAAPWASLPEWALSQRTFIHHRTYQNVHGQHDNVMRLLGNALGSAGTGTENVASLYSSETSSLLGTIQQEPIALGGNALTFEGRALQSVSPQTLATLFSPESGTALQLTQLRQQRLDEINAVLRSNGTSAQREWLDRYATSREQIQALDESLLETFSSITSDDQDAQIAAAVALIQMQVSPVIQIAIEFGGDNHVDGGLANEAAQYVTGVQAISSLLTQLETAGLQDRVTVANLSVFGRTLAQKGTRGRNHNLNHHVMMISGANVNPGVVGSIAASGNDFGATGIDSVTGAGSDDADIPADETLEGATKTLGAALGISNEQMDLRINGGKVIQAALSS